MRVLCALLVSVTLLFEETDMGYESLECYSQGRCVNRRLGQPGMEE